MVKSSHRILLSSMLSLCYWSFTCRWTRWIFIWLWGLWGCFCTFRFVCMHWLIISFISTGFYGGFRCVILICLPSVFVCLSFWSIPHFVFSGFRWAICWSGLISLFFFIWVGRGVLLFFVLFLHLGDANNAEGCEFGFLFPISLNTSLHWQ